MPGRATQAGPEVNHQAEVGSAGKSGIVVSMGQARQVENWLV